MYQCPRKSACNVVREPTYSIDVTQSVGYIHIGHFHWVVHFALIMIYSTNWRRLGPLRPLSIENIPPTKQNNNKYHIQGGYLAASLSPPLCIGFVVIFDHFYDAIKRNLIINCKFAKSVIDFVAFIF